MKTKKKNVMTDVIIASRKKSREEEIAAHGKPVNYRKIVSSKKVYNRKRNKADDEHLPYSFLYVFPFKLFLKRENSFKIVFHIHNSPIFPVGFY